MLHFVSVVHCFKAVLVVTLGSTHYVDMHMCMYRKRLSKHPWVLARLGPTEVGGGACLMQATLLQSMCKQLDPYAGLWANLGCVCVWGGGGGGSYHAPQWAFSQYFMVFTS